jgi:hypothetical protein
MSADWIKLENKEGAAEAIRRMGEEDLVFLNRLIAERLKLIFQARSTGHMANFSVGDRVAFHPTNNTPKTGTVQRLNKKTATILTDEGEHWKVHPALLRQIK